MRAKSARSALLLAIASIALIVVGVESSRFVPSFRPIGKAYFPLPCLLLTTQSV